IDMVSRADRIITSGKTRSDISQGTLDSIREDAEEELADGDYYEGCVDFIDGVELEMNNSFWYEFTLFMPIKILIAAGVALVSVLFMMASTKAKITVNSGTYSSNGLKVHRQEDRFINTTVTTRRIESSSSGSRSGGGGGGGNSGSSGGHF
ncbi:MAG: TPM domain-containing protein, partial [Lachnospira sp.]|nr:TPM domain-containing protein [Lachnospira sp.]